MDTNKFHSGAKAVLRYGFAVVFLWFGLSQILNPGQWLGFIPAWITAISGLSAHTFVLGNGIFEVACALLLVCNIWTQWVALLLFLHMISIVTDVGATAIGVRDLGLSVALLSLTLLYWKKKEN